MNKRRNRIRFAFCVVFLALIAIQAEAQNKKKVAINAPRPKVAAYNG